MTDDQISGSSPRPASAGPPAAGATWPDAPFHQGERQAQRLAGHVVPHAPIRPFMPDQHRRFFATLPFVVLAGSGAPGTAEAGAPVAGVVSGPTGFISSPDAVTLQLAGGLPSADPLAAALRPGLPFGLLGIELATRRRNRANGRVVAAGPQGVTLAVEQSFGNCPQYIQARAPVETAPGPGAGPVLDRFDQPDTEVARLVAAADTLFVASSSGAAALPGGGLDVSHRGGPAGFLRLTGRRLTIPDFPGNGYFNTLGNFLLDPRAALLLIDFDRGDLLHLSGTVTIDWRPDVSLPGAVRLWQVDISHGWWLRGALPWRWTPPDAAPGTRRIARDAAGPDRP